MKSLKWEANHAPSTVNGSQLQTVKFSLGSEYTRTRGSVCLTDFRVILHGGVRLWSWLRGVWDRWIPRACWPACLASLVSIKPMRKPISKEKEKEDGGEEKVEEKVVFSTTKSEVCQAWRHGPGGSLNGGGEVERPMSPWARGWVLRFSRLPVWRPQRQSVST